MTLTLSKFSPFFSSLRVDQPILYISWLAQAELSTYSPSPRSLYLSHQFSFWSFPEDYHALLRQYQFTNVRGTKIHVRPQVQVSMMMGLECDRFVDDTTTTTTHTGFTRGISSALSSDLLTDSNARSLPVLPAYPNGVGRTSSFTASSKTPAFIRNAMPIRKLGDGMSDGLDRIKREISSSYHYYHHRHHRHHHHHHHRRMSEEDSAEDDSVPLEFGEEDEDFWNLATQDQQPQPDDDNDDNDNDEELWNSRDVMKMVEEMEKFDDISVVGLLDEEQQVARTLRNKSR